MQSIGKADDFGRFMHDISGTSQRQIFWAKASSHDAVFEYRHTRERLHDLVSAGHTAASDAIRRLAGDILPFEHNPTLIRRTDTIDDVEDSRLAGAVRTNQAKDLAISDRETQTVNGVYSAKALIDSDDVKECSHWSSHRTYGHRL